MEKTNLLPLIQKKRRAWLNSSSTSQQWAFILIVALGLWLLLLNSIPQMDDNYRGYDYNSGSFFQMLSQYYEHPELGGYGGYYGGYYLEFSVPFQGAFVCFLIATVVVALYALLMTKTPFLSGLFWSIFSFVYHFIIFTPVEWCYDRIKLPTPYLIRSILFFALSVAIFWTVYAVLKILLSKKSTEQGEDQLDTTYVHPRLTKKQSLVMILQFLPFFFLPICFVLFKIDLPTAVVNIYQYIMALLPLLVPFIMLFYARKSIVKIHSVLEISCLSTMIYIVFALGCCSPLFTEITFYDITYYSGSLYMSNIIAPAVFQLLALFITSWIFACKAGSAIASDNLDTPTFERKPASLGRALLGLSGFSAAMLFFAFSTFLVRPELFFDNILTFLTILPFPFATHYARYCMFRSQKPVKSALLGFFIIPITAIICAISVLVSFDKLPYCLLLGLGAFTFLIHLWVMYGLYALAKRIRSKKLAKLAAATPVNAEPTA